MTEHINVTLSESGQRRKQEILSDVVGAAHSLRRRRRQRKQATIAVCLAVLSGLALWLAIPGPEMKQAHREIPVPPAVSPVANEELNVVIPDTTVPSPGSEVVTEVVTTPKRSLVEFEIVETSESVMDRYIIDSTVPSTGRVVFEILDDDALVREMISWKLPWGLANFEGHTVLIPHEQAENL
ncbi:hypothetical protein AB1L42_14560 [Thalassoglobus sp. JC818]|uniref:hypothetical protein n=1 Tax=Thalassoglobus sp. JC818 TaxID=3232136 RepID=UPI0034597A11